mgnify:CR=1 FL=1
MYAAPTGGLFVNLYILLGWIHLPQRLARSSYSNSAQLAITMTVSLSLWAVITLPWALAGWPALKDALNESNDALLAVSLLSLFLCYHIAALHKMKRIAYHKQNEHLPFITMAQVKNEKKESTKKKKRRRRRRRRKKEREGNGEMQQLGQCKATGIKAIKKT